jgi:hypothetical protein
MKIKLDIDCTPEEARAFMGLPDVRPLQDEMMGLLRERMMKAAQAMDPEALLRTWMPGGAQGFEALQKAFWDALSGGKPKS